MSKLATVVSALTLVVDFRVAATSSTLSNVLSASVSMKVAICANLALFAASAASESDSTVSNSACVATSAATLAAVTALAAKSAVMISPAARVKLPPERSVVPVDVMPVKPEATVPANTVSKLATVVSVPPSKRALAIVTIESPPT